MDSFAQRYDRTIGKLEQQFSDFVDEGYSFDFDRRGDVLTIEFEDGEKFVITPQAPTEQLWVSANYAGHRFNWSEADTEWKNEKSGEAFVPYLSHAMSERLGKPIDLS